MLKTAQFTSYRMVRPSTTPHHASSINPAETTLLPSSGKYIASTAEACGCAGKREDGMKEGEEEVVERNGNLQGERGIEGEVEGK